MPAFDLKAKTSTLKISGEFFDIFGGVLASTYC